MFDNDSFEDILKRMLDRIPNSINKSENEITYDLIASIAMEIKQNNIDTEINYQETFASTATRKGLIEKAKERGLYPKQASFAILKGIFNKEVPIGARFTCGTLVYVATKKNADFEYEMTCETAGTIGNNNSGRLIPIDYIDGLETAELGEILIPGEDEEDTESLRQRYFNSFNAKAYGGNRADYIEKVTSIPGVSSCKVKRVEYEGGFIYVTILSSIFRQASEALVLLVQEILDPTQDMSGVGLAPVDHKVQVQTVEEISIDVSINAIYDTGYSFESLLSEITAAIEEYLLSLRQDWSNQEHIVVRMAQIEASLLNIDGIIDINQIKLNNLVSNVILTENKIPILGNITKHTS